MTLESMEAQMSEEEFHKWLVYNKFEPLNSLEIQLALLTTVVSSALGGKATVKDFMVGKSPYEEEVPEFDGKALNAMVKGMF